MCPILEFSLQFYSCARCGSLAFNPIAVDRFELPIFMSSAVHAEVRLVHIFWFGMCALLFSLPSGPGCFRGLVFHCWTTQAATRVLRKRGRMLALIDLSLVHNYQYDPHCLSNTNWINLIGPWVIEPKSVSLPMPITFVTDHLHRINLDTSFRLNGEL